MFKPILGEDILASDNPLTKGLVGCWLMNDGTGDRVADLSGNGNDGTLSNGASWTVGPYGSVIDFDGVDDIVTANSLLSGLTEVTVMVRVNHKVSGGSSFGGWVSSNTAYNGGFFIGITASSVQVYVSSIKTQTSGGLNKGQYDWWTFTFVGSSFVRIYRNEDLLVENTTSIPANVPSHTGIEIGRNITSALASACLISDANIFTKALSTAEVRQIVGDSYQIFDTGFNPAIFGAAAPAGISIPVVLHHLRQQGAA